MIPSKNSSDNSFDLLTQKYVGLNYTDAILVNTYFTTNQTFAIDDKALYLEKLTNLNGKIVNLSTVQYIPYTWIDEVV